MIYKDYYSLLEISQSATIAEIKSNYKKLSKRWHPDINKSPDATHMMQEINEAYLILSDFEARNRYNKIYEFYYNQKTSNFTKGDTNSRRAKNENFTDRAEDIPKTEKQADSAVPSDPILDDWILKAKNQAKDVLAQSLIDAKGITTNGLKYTAYSICFTVVLFVVIIIIVSLLFRFM